MRDRSLANNVASLLICGLLAGLVVAAAAFPALAVTGLAAKAGADNFQELPNDLEVVPPPETSYLYAADGKTRITGFYEENRQNITLKEMSPLMQKAIVSAEDTRFYDHHGVDLKGIMRALVANSKAGETRQGASTLTMQYVRQALTYSARTAAERTAAKEQTNTRKIREIRYAIALEKRLSKDQILENYLNIAYFGHNAYGVYAASYAYFSKHPKDLKLEEAAMLASMVQAPSVYNPASKDPKVRDATLARRNWVISRMVDMGYVDAKAAEAAHKAKLVLKRKAPPNTCVDIPPNHKDWGFFCDYFVTWWRSQKAFGANTAEREANLKGGGYKIITSLDPKLQSAAMKNILAKKDVHNKYALGGVFIEPGTGRIKAMAINRLYSNINAKNHAHSDPRVLKKNPKAKGNYPNTTNRLFGGDGGLGYQAGSVFKMFTMLAALEEGMPLATGFQSPHQYKSQYAGDSTSKSTCKVNDEDRWCPKNASKHMAGMRNMWSGFGMSVNTYFVQLIETVGTEKVVRMAERLGLTWHGNDIKQATDPAQTKEWGSFTLGVANTTPLELANAYAAIAADGKLCDPLPVNKVLDRTGKEMPVAPSCKQVLSPDVARAATDAARCPVGDQAQGGNCGGGPTGGSVGRNIKQPVAGKTGTTDDNKASWFAGYTPKLAGATFEVDPDYFDRSVYSLTDATYLFGETLRDYYGDAKMKNFPKPPASLAKGNMVPIPSVTCRSPGEAKRILEEAGFKVREYPDRVPSNCGEGSVAYVRPTGQAPKGGYVTIVLSNGEKPKPDPSKSPPKKPGDPTEPPGGDPTCRPSPRDPCWPPPDNGD
ncbi:MAG: penicillin-binding protein [Micromonosporaceae bacterium]